MMIEKHLEKQSRGRRSWLYGLLAEWFAIIFFRCKGYKLFKHRHRTPFGEIDLVAWKGTTIVFVEVKFRSLEEDLLHAVPEYQKIRIEHAAQYFARKFPSHYTLRMDVLLVKPWRFPVHIENAWDSHQ
jgi:putative endonuclease